jgi:hypothetical protein
MPAAALAERKNLGWIGPVSKMSDNEDSTAALRNSCVLRVEGPIGPLVPEFAQRPEEGTKVPSSSRRQNTGDVLSNDPLDLEVVCEREEREREVSSRVRKSFAEARDAERLTGGSSNKKVN